MPNQLTDCRVAILATDGVERVELEQPCHAVTDAGGWVELLSIRETEIRVHNDAHDAGTFPVDRRVSNASVDDYDALILPGGTVKPDKLPTHEEAVRFVRDFFESGKPIGAICHGPWTLVAAGVVSGRRMTSYPSLHAGLRNAGAKVVDQEVVADDGLVTSRNPGDLPAFCRKIVEEFARSAHERRTTLGTARSH
jgi:protease I